MSSSKTALITGASRGLGQEMARALNRRGWRLILDARGERALHTVSGELDAAEVIAIAGDVTDPAHRADLIEAARRLGGVDALVNNASSLGVSPLPALLDYPVDALLEVFRTNVLAPLALTQELASLLIAGSRIVNVTSDAAVEPYEGWGGYGASKAALEQLSAVLAAENPQWRVYWVDPGDMRTDMHQDAFPGEDISDRPHPAEHAPAFVRLLEGDLPSGRYSVVELLATATALEV